jgi:hypothetical protein
MHVHAFLGTILAQKVCLKETCAHASPRLGAEEGANACLGKVAENCKNVGVNTVLERGSAARIDADGFA